MGADRVAERVAGNRQKHESSNPLQRKLIDRFHAETARLVEMADPSTILDLGCGEGFVLEALSEAGVSAALTGIDLSAEAVAEARERVGDRAEILEGDVRDLRSTIDNFDVVMMLEVLEHLDDPADALGLIAELSNSHVIVSVPWEPFFRGLNFLRLKNLRRWGSDPEHVQHWTRRSFKNFVASRFHIVESGSAFPWTLLLLEPRGLESSDL